MHVPNEIPDEQRLAVRRRERFLCLRCRGRGSDWHHRRRRGVADEHTHCTCNGVLLCRKCHSWAHNHPLEAREQGWIVSVFEPSPRRVPVDSFRGVIYLTCSGGYYANGDRK